MAIGCNPLDLLSARDGGSAKWQDQDLDLDLDLDRAARRAPGHEKGAAVTVLLRARMIPVPSPIPTLIPSREGMGSPVELRGVC